MFFCLGGPESCDLDPPKRVQDCLPEVVGSGWVDGVGVVAWVAWVFQASGPAIRIIDLQPIMRWRSIFYSHQRVLGCLVNLTPLNVPPSGMRVSSGLAKGNQWLISPPPLFFLGAKPRSFNASRLHICSCQACQGPSDVGSLWQWHFLALLWGQARDLGGNFQGSWTSKTHRMQLGKPKTDVFKTGNKSRHQPLSSFWFLVTFFIAAILPPLLPSGILQLWRNVPGFWQLLQPRLSELMDPLRSMKNAIQLRVKLTTSLARESAESFRAPAAFLRGLLTNTAEMSSEALSGLVMALRNLAFSKTKLHQILRTG